MSQLDAVFFKGFMFAFTAFLLTRMISDSTWPDFVNGIVLLLVWAGLGYGVLQERKRGYQNPPPWWDRFLKK